MSGTVAHMPSAPSLALLAGAAPDPHWSAWRASYDRVRWPVAAFLSVAMTAGVAIPVADRIVHSHSPMPLHGPGAVTPDRPPWEWSAEPLPLAGTASYGFHAAPPFGVVDPMRPEPATLDLTRVRRDGG